MKKQEKPIRSIDPDDYPLGKRVILAFLLFPFGIYYFIKTPKDHGFSRKVYSLTTILSMFTYFVIIIAIIVQS